MSSMKRDCRRVLALSRKLVYVGILMLLALWALSRMVGPEHVVCYLLMAAAFGFMLVGVLYCRANLKCPHCGMLLFNGKTMPRKLPEQCPHCNKPL